MESDEMNVNREIANRALEKAGQEPLVEDDIIKNTARWRVIKSFYLSTLLETLYHTSWTSLKVRAKLEKAENKDNLTDFEFMYKLPLDCAKPEELSNEAPFITEGNYLYTNEQDAVLLYITNGYNKYRYEELKEQPTEETFENDLYFYYDEESEEYVQESVFDENKTYYTKSKDDYPEYDELELDPMLSQYLETRLASKIVLKITGDNNLYQLLYSEATLMEQKAANTSYIHNRNKAQGNPFWGDQLGLSS